jgi:beta-glucosidase
MCTHGAVPFISLAPIVLVMALAGGGCERKPLRAGPASGATMPTENPSLVDSEEFIAGARRPAGPPEAKHAADVERWLGRMTLREKVGQMTQLTLSMVCDGKDEALAVSPEKLHKAVVEYGVGSILNVNERAIPRDGWHAILRAIQNESKKSRLGIPVLYGIDTIHGANYVAEGTMFPQPLGMAATFDPELLLRASRIAAAETRRAGIPWTFSPILDVGRQPLWSRLYETFGEDTYLATVMGLAAVRGYEGDDVSSPQQVAACMKHYVGYSFPKSGQDRTTAVISDGALREYFLPTFAAAIRAGAHTLMVNSGDVNGVPGHINHRLLTTVLRGELGFRGLVVSDWQDIKRLVDPHRVAKTEKEATLMSITAGVDMSMVPDDYSFSDLLLALVEEGSVPMARIDEAVRRVLALKYELGLFDDPLRGASAGTSIGGPEARRASLEAAHASITLLKNAHRTLPLAKGMKVLVTGPTADSLVPLNNGWTYTWTGSEAPLYPKDRPTILKAIESKLGAGHVTYVQGASHDQEVDVARAAAAAARSDVTVLCLGEQSYAEGTGNIDDLNLPRAQLNLAEQVLAAGKPVVVVLVEGRPRIIRSLTDKAAAIVMAYNPSHEGGTALADILFGDVNPSGKLPITYPRSTTDLATYEERAAGDPTSEFEFGHGLSYTTFAYSELEVSPGAGSPAGKWRVAVTVKNTGDRAGKEVVLLYVVPPVTVGMPKRRLRRFAKVALEPGQSRTVTFELSSGDFSFIGEDQRPRPVRGTFGLLVGNLRASLETQ